MRVWMSSETAVDKGDGDIDDILWKLYMGIEKTINHFLEEIEYSNDGIEELRLILVLRDDEFRGTEGGEALKKKRGKQIYSRSPRIDYDTFKNADENQRKKLIYKTILESFEQLKQKDIHHLEVIEEYIQEKMILLEA